MSDDEQIDEAAEAAKSAGRNARKAGKNAVKVVQVGTGAVVEVAADELAEAAEKLEGTAQDVVDAARRVNPRVLSRISSDAGQGLMALSVAIWAGTLAANKFRGVYAGRKAVMTRPID